MSTRFSCFSAHPFFTIAILVASSTTAVGKDIQQTARVPGTLAQEVHLNSGQSVTISARVDKPSDRSLIIITENDAIKVPAIG